MADEQRPDAGHPVEIDSGLTALLRDRVPFADTLGVQVFEASAARVCARLTFDPRLCTDVGTIHGGALMALADVCGGICAGLGLPAGSAGTTTIESKTNFLRPVRSGYVDAISQPLHAGSTTIVVETDLFDRDRRRAARIMQTQAVLWPRAERPST